MCVTWEFTSGLHKGEPETFLRILKINRKKTRPAGPRGKMTTEWVFCHLTQCFKYIYKICRLTVYRLKTYATAARPCGKNTLNFWTQSHLISELHVESRSFDCYFKSLLIPRDNTHSGQVVIRHLCTFRHALFRLVLLEIWPAVTDCDNCGSSVNIISSRVLSAIYNIIVSVVFIEGFTCLHSFYCEQCKEFMFFSLDWDQKDTK